ncbi:hypothetical protein [Burkholderia humptydooensis]|uniref:hypothetical protein n=1 Tax=Burkholderia humptydooensis TaxID=430531 RepID=UPI0018E08964|nr:hypothetical protein [Burkholderia humptydooensis]
MSAIVFDESIQRRSGVRITGTLDVAGCRQGVDRRDLEAVRRCNRDEMAIIAPVAPFPRDARGHSYISKTI